MISSEVGALSGISNRAYQTAQFDMDYMNEDEYWYLCMHGLTKTTFVLSDYWTSKWRYITVLGPCLNNSAQVTAARYGVEIGLPDGFSDEYDDYFHGVGPVYYKPARSFNKKEVDRINNLAKDTKAKLDDAPDFVNTVSYQKELQLFRNLLSRYWKWFRGHDFDFPLKRTIDNRASAFARGLYDFLSLGEFEAVDCLEYENLKELLTSAKDEMPKRFNLTYDGHRSALIRAGFYVTGSDRSKQSRRQKLTEMLERIKHYVEDDVHPSV